MTKKIVKKKVDKERLALDQRNLMIVKLREFGNTFQDIAYREGITKERVRQIYKRMKEKEAALQ